MAFDLTTISTFINSPPGQFVAGGVLAGIVWKFFERVEAVLKDDTKLEIAIWLLGVTLGQKLEPWPETFARVFDRVFGQKHLSWKCFWRSSLASLVIVSALFSLLVLQPRHRGFMNFLLLSPLAFCANVFLLNMLPDYVSLLESRYILTLMRKSSSGTIWFVLLIVDTLVTTAIAFAAANLGGKVYLNMMLLTGLGSAAASNPMFWKNLLFDALKGLEHYSWSPRLLSGNMSELYFYPAFFTSVWLWLYTGSGFLLKFARRFDIGFQWFNSKVDIEHKPLSAIGLVAGALVAVIWWTVVIVKWIV